MMEDLINELHLKELELAQNKISLMELEFDRDSLVAEIQLKTKDEWKEMGITNAEGRKAFIDDETSFIKNEILETKADIIRCEVAIKDLKRKLDFCFWKYESGEF